MNGAQQISSEDIVARLQESDPEMREAMASDTIISAIGELETKFKITPITRVALLSRIIGWFMLDLISAQDFVTQLKNVGVKPEEFETFKKDIVEKVFEPYRFVFERNGIDYRTLLATQPLVSIPVVAPLPPPPREVPVTPKPTVEVKPSALPPAPPTQIPVQKPGSTIEIRPFEPEKLKTPPPPLPPAGGAPRITFPQTPPVAVRPPEPSAPMPPPPPKEEEKIHIREVRFTPTPKPEEAPRVIVPQVPKAPEAPAPETKPTPTSFPPITFITPTEPPAPPPKPAQPPPVIKPEEKPKPAQPPGTEVIDLSTFEIRKSQQPPPPK